jgi:hypothetical protein
MRPAELPNQREMAQLAITFLHRVDLKGIEARRMTEVLLWLEMLAREVPSDG